MFFLKIIQKRTKLRWCFPTWVAALPVACSLSAGRRTDPGWSHWWRDLPQSVDADPVIRWKQDQNFMAGLAIIWPPWNVDIYIYGYIYMDIYCSQYQNPSVMDSSSTLPIINHPSCDLADRLVQCKEKPLSLALWFWLGYRITDFWDSRWIAD